MPRSYTKTGDKGDSGRFGGERRKKSDALFEAVGSIDELAAWLGFAASFTKEEKIAHAIARLEQFLFCAGADLATPLQQPCRRRILKEDTKVLEQMIEAFDEELSELSNFILPLGSSGVAALHVARAVARRAERKVVALGQKEEINQALVPFLNRLSSFLFVMARWLNCKEGGKEEHPTYNP